MYGSEIWALGKAEQKLFERTEMRMLRWMMGIKRIEKIKNDGNGRTPKDSKTETEVE